MKIMKQLQSINSIFGVDGCYFASGEGKLISSILPSSYDDVHVSEITKAASEILAVFRLETPDCREVKIDFEQDSIFVRGLPDRSLFIVIMNSERDLKKIRAAVDTAAEELIETIPTRYEIQKAIGEGGTAVVYSAYDKNLNREVALKRFHQGEILDKAHADYSAELGAISKIDHANVVNLYDVGRDEAGHYITMALIDGEDLEKTIQRSPLEFNRFLQIADQSLEGLMAIHEAKVLHLDLKPSNIMISTPKRGRMRLRIVDFGRSRILDSDGEVKCEPGKRSLDGSIHFMSPEQIANQAVDARSDIYSLGCVFYYLLTQSYPFEGSNVIQVMSSHMLHRVKPLGETNCGIPKWLQDLVMSMIQTDPAARPQSVQEIVDQLSDGESDHKIVEMTGSAPQFLAMGVTS